MNTDKVIQGSFTFNVDPHSMKIKDTKYDRVKGKFLTGNKEEKHTTADTVKKDMWVGLDGMDLGDFILRLFTIIDTYLNLPGMALLQAHVRKTEGNLGQLNGPMNNNYDSLISSMEEMEKIKKDLGPVLDQYMQINLASAGPDLIGRKQQYAFLLLTQGTDLIRHMEAFRDLMPLVNVMSGAQVRGKEREARKTLRGGSSGTELEALWDFFDFEAISEMMGSYKNDDELYGMIQDSIPWLDIDYLYDYFHEFASHKGEITAKHLAHYIASLMLSNHIELIKLSYPEQARSANISDEKVMRDVLKARDVPADHDLLIYYMFHQEDSQDMDVVSEVVSEEEMEGVSG
ncbi:hypothetical protein [Brevibacillus borstelensis]|uniref:hypothetical protein n=1 Tax=Brevibacillus borstelensis TaxID=45462 RepID=UPI0030BE170F